MFDAAIKALTQMFSPPFRRVLLKSIGLALLLIVLFGIGLQPAVLLAGGQRRRLGRSQRSAGHTRLAGPGLDAVDRGRRSASSPARCS